MGLRDLTSDLTSLKFNDFKSDSNPKPKPAIVKKIGKGGRNSTFDVQGILLSKRLDDVIRMAKLVVARPGLEFAAKQAIGALIQANQSKESFATDSSMFKLVLQPALDILASAVTNIGQTAVNGLGVHLNKGLKEIKGEDFRSYEVRALDKSIRKGDLDVHKFSGKSGRIRKAEKLKLDSSRFQFLQGMFYGRLDSKVLNQDSRADQWARFYDNILESPIIGNGYTSFSKSLIDEKGQGVHNIFLLIFGESGFLPFLLFLALSIWLLKRTFTSIGHNSENFLLLVVLLITFLVSHNFFSSGIQIFIMVLIIYRILQGNYSKTI